MSAAYRAGWDRIFGQVVRAEVVETFRYVTCNRLRGCVFYRGQVRLPGMVVIDLDEVEGSITKEHRRLEELEFNEFRDALLEVLEAHK